METTCVNEQEMAAIVCIFKSRPPYVVSAYCNAHEARAALAGMRESGEAATWDGTLVVADSGTATMHVDVDKLLQDARIDGDIAAAIVEEVNANNAFMKRYRESVQGH